MQEKCITRRIFHKNLAKSLPLSVIMFLLHLVFLSTTSVASRPLNTITIDNQSGQVVKVKVLGPSKSFIKVPLDGKRTVHVKQGKYYFLARYGFSPKEFVYTKSEPFMVTEPDGQYSKITFTLHRVVDPHPSAQRVSEDEFESSTLTEGEK